MEMNEEGKRRVSWEDNEVGFKNFKWVSSVTSSLNSDGLKGYMDLGQKLSGQIGPCFKFGETSKSSCELCAEACNNRLKGGRKGGLFDVVEGVGGQIQPYF